MKHKKLLVFALILCTALMSINFTSYADTDYGIDIGYGGTHNQLSGGTDGKYVWQAGRYCYVMGTEKMQAYGWVKNTSSADAGKTLYSTARIKHRFTGVYSGDGSTTYILDAYSTGVKVYDYSGSGTAPSDTEIFNYICVYNYKTM